MTFIVRISGHKVRFLVTFFASLRSRAKRTLYDLYCPYFSPQSNG